MSGAYERNTMEMTMSDNKVLLIQGEGLGSGDDKLGGMLMANFLRVLGDCEGKPKAIILWNTGVRLAAKSSNVLGYLQRLEQQGVEIRACTTCLEFFDKVEELGVGKPTTMPVSVDALLRENAICL